MTEVEWLVTLWPTTKIEAVKSLRKRKLFMVACCKQSMDSREYLQYVIKNLEAEASGTDCFADLIERFGWRDPYARMVMWAAHERSDAIGPFMINASSVLISDDMLRIIDCIIGNPFAELLVGNPTSQKIAQAIYDLNDYSADRLGVLADSLEDNGIEGEPIKHLRNGKHHHKGCWVIDQLLGKE